MTKRSRKVTGKCKKCPYVGEFDLEDIGIGSYEYWGAKGYDSNIVAVCPECGSTDVEITSDDYYEE